MTRQMVWLINVGLLLFVGPVSAAMAEETRAPNPDVGIQSAHESPAPIQDSKDPWSDWHYGAYLDLAYIVNFNFPENHLWRSRSTANRTNELDPNMGLVYVRKDATSGSRWGMEFGAQGGYDSKAFAFLQGEPKVAGGRTRSAIFPAPMCPISLLSEGRISRSRRACSTA